MACLNHISSPLEVILLLLEAESKEFKKLVSKIIKRKFQHEVTK